MKLTNNIAAMRTLDSLYKTQKKSATSMERLSSGIRINRAKDDAAGLAISNKMDSQIKGLKQANRNTMDGISMLQTAEGALNEVHEILQRARELAVQASNGTNASEDTEKIQEEINQLLSEINRITNTTEFNSQKMLTGKELNKTGLSITEMAGGSDISKSSGKVIISNLNLENTSITIDNIRVDFFNSSNKEYRYSDGIGIDLNGIMSINDLAKAVEDSLNGRTENVTVKANANTLDIVSNNIGEKYNNIKLKDGGNTENILNLQTGSNMNQLSELKFQCMSTEYLGLTGKASNYGFTQTSNVASYAGDNKLLAAISVTTYDNANNAIEAIDSAIEKVSSQRGLFGATQNRLEYAVRNLEYSEENLTSSLSRILDTDMASEMAEYTQLNVMSQASTAMLAQANQRPQQVLQLLNK